MYYVVKTMITRPISEKEIAKNIAKHYREQGFRSEVITEEEYKVKYLGNQQDLTRV